MSEVKLATKQAPAAVKLAIDLGPLLVFFLANALGGIFWATGTYMVAFFAAMAVGYYIERKVEVMPLFTGIVVLIFGGLTLLLKDETFVKVKLTILYGAFSLILFGGLATGRPLIRIMFERAFQLTDEGWRKLTLRWACFFAGLAILNEILRRVLTTNQWVDFKVFGVMVLIVIFTITQSGLVSRYAHNDQTEDKF